MKDKDFHIVDVTATVADNGLARTATLLNVSVACIERNILLEKPKWWQIWKRRWWRRK